MTICGLSLHHGNTESRKNLEQKLINVTTLPSLTMTSCYLLNCFGLSRTSPGSPVLNKKYTFWHAQPSPLTWANLTPLSSSRMTSCFPLHYCGWRRTSPGSPALNKKYTFWLAKPSPPDLGQRDPAIFTHKDVVLPSELFWFGQNVPREPCTK